MIAGSSSQIKKKEKKQMHVQTKNFQIDLDGFQLLILIGLVFILILLIIAMIGRRKNAKASEQGSKSNLKLNEQQIAKLDLIMEQNKQILSSLEERKGKQAADNKSQEKESAKQ